MNMKKTGWFVAAVMFAGAGRNGASADKPLRGCRGCGLLAGALRKTAVRPSFRREG